jgi:D-arabinose 1-dehydrogenase-like Zn-dependent alcohol dehydrogenase
MECSDILASYILLQLMDSSRLITSNFRAQKDDDVTIKVLYCGICHTDLYTIKNEWGTAMYPVVPG